ncbi:SDR family oxidoreductase [Nocardioides humi]|uniref:NAD-dependent epimerase/dehydratase domain-containing protein n=1 Tax=Nocardioides humi TaxID=449461 RepID=A0ABN2ALI5_9ACTN|nr:NAD-dependent epimerase/dehydratase family protein [Nocardioides humi]
MTERPHALVVGGGGLLGSHVLGALRAEGIPAVGVPVPWSHHDAARAALRQSFEDIAARAAGGPIDVLWCAGAGVVATPREALEAEVLLFREILDDLAEVLPANSDLAFFLASSAGGVYAGSVRPPFTEETVPKPLTPYGEAKLAMEHALLERLDHLAGVALIGRLANLYGPGQDLSKPQGLMSRLCVVHLTGEPLAVRVSLDTIRDYLYVEDCADMVVAGLAGLRERAETTGERSVVKVMATGQGTTVAQLIGESNRIFHRRARMSVISGSAHGQVRDLRLRSVVWPELQRHIRTPLPAGFHRTADDVAGKVFSGALVESNRKGAR